MFDQAELRGTPMGSRGPPSANGTAQIAPKIAILCNRAFWVILVILANIPFWSFWLAISEPGLVSRKKVPYAVLLEST